MTDSAQPRGIRRIGVVIGLTAALVAGGYGLSTAWAQTPAPTPTPSTPATPGSPAPSNPDNSGTKPPDDPNCPNMGPNGTSGPPAAAGQATRLRNGSPRMAPSRATTLART